MSIVYQYENSTIQHGDNKGNINHVGVLSSNTQNTPNLSDSLPTTSTGSSLGHYHYTEPSTNALQLLNSSGTGSGGHSFYISTSTTAPVETARFDSNGMTIDRSTAGGANLVNLPNVTISGAVFVIFQTPINVPPWNFVGFGNPVQVTQNTANLQTGITYYLQASSPQAGKISLNPDGTGNVNTADLSSLPQPILAWVNGTGPSIEQTININENLTITSDTLNSTLTSSALTFNGTNIKMNQVQPTLVYSSAAIYADAQPPATSLSIRNTYGYSGWYFKNIVLGQKINWYFPPKTPITTQVQALRGISISFFNGVNTSNDNTLFITILTVPTGSNDFAPGFFHSSMTYIFDQTINPISNTNYQGVCIINKLLVPFNYETQIQYQESPINNPRGTYLPTDNILAVVIGTSSGASLNGVELVVNKLNLHYVDFTQSYLLVSP